MTVYTDNPDFYPTPKSLFKQLINDLKYVSGRVLEPSAGKGDMIKYLEEINRNIGGSVDAIENDPRLVSTLMGAGYKVVWDDFLTYETYKEYDFIIMNPPFSNGVDHVLKALDLAENQLSQCKIYAILNKETLNNAYSNKRQELLRRLERHGAEIEYVKDAFTQAERKTRVEVALIRVFVEKLGNGRSIYDSIPFTSMENENTVKTLETALSTQVKSNEIDDKLSDIKRLVLEYEKACELIRTTYQAIQDKYSFFSYINRINKRKGDVTGPFTYVIQNDYKVNDLNAELDRLRGAYWELILDTDDFRDMLTNESRERLNRQINVAEAMEINLENIRMLLAAIGANRKEMLIESIVAMFERITQYHMNEYSTNIHYYNGWKTNDAYAINKKIIIPINRGGFDSWDISKKYEHINTRVRNFIDDLVKTFQLIDSRFNNKFEYIGNNTFENELLRFRMFKNGNIHVWFNDLNALKRMNYICGQHFNWIPSDGEQKENEEARKWVEKEFGDIGETKLMKI